MSETQITTPSGIPVLHGDHGLTQQHLALVDDTVFQHKGFFLVLVDLPDNAPPLMSSLYGPSCGDAVIDEDQVEYVVRADRPGPSRVMQVRPRPVRKMVVVGVSAGDESVVFSAYGSQVIPQREWWDSSMKPQEAVLAARFWSEHALADTRWTELGPWDDIHADVEVAVRPVEGKDQAGLEFRITEEGVVRYESHVLGFYADKDNGTAGAYVYAGPFVDFKPEGCDAKVERNVPRTASCTLDLPEDNKGLSVDLSIEHEGKTVSFSLIASSSGCTPDSFLYENYGTDFDEATPVCFFNLDIKQVTS